MPKTDTLNPQVLGQILVLQSTLHAAPDTIRLSEQTFVRPEKEANTSATYSMMTRNETERCSEI